MEMLEAMRACLPGGYVARKAYPNRKYYKDESGIFLDAAKVDRIDYISGDWDHYPGKNGDSHD
jgi:hypothetical protein